MGLLDLLKDPSAYRVGTIGENMASKGVNIDYPGTKYGLSQGPLLGRRVSFDVTNPNADPTFEIGDNIPYAPIDDYIRGGLTYAEEARETDFERIKKFLYETSAGNLFLAKQVTLQSLNPQPQKLYNLGVNTLASVASAGLTNVRRGGLLPSIGDFDLGAVLGFDGGTYVGVVGDENGTKLREKNYGLGDPGKPDASNSLKALIDNINPFGAFGNKLEYNMTIEGSIDKVNNSPIFEDSDNIPSLYEPNTKDFVPFRFEIHNYDGPNHIIVFRAYLDSISDDYSATHNTHKYNGRGEEFFSYNKFNRKIQVSFKIAAQTRSEMQPIYNKINYLAAQTAPNYSSEGRIRTPFCKLTVGNWFNRLPGLISQVGLQWQKDYPWEIALDRNVDVNSGQISGKDVDMLILPHVLDVNISFQPIHTFTPKSNFGSPFLSITGNKGEANFITEPARNYDPNARTDSGEAASTDSPVSLTPEELSGIDPSTEINVGGGTPLYTYP